MNKERFNECCTPEPNSGCWLWTARISRRYGSAHHNGKTESAHRIAWQLYKGEIPQGAFVLHRCDTPMCVNPEHLFLGSASDNMRDMAHKGRAKSGAQKLTAKQVLEIRSKTGTLRALGKEYGVDFRTIHDIKTRRNWKVL
jgi:vacuolar-type H+-ATPase subunit B/Vma2